MSARYAGEGCSYDDNNRKLLLELEAVPAEERGAVFRCVVALGAESGEVTTVEGRTHGVILLEPRGAAGFGYDCLFLPDGEMLSYAEMSPDEKNTVSHRGRALERARELIARLA